MVEVEEARDIMEMTIPEIAEYTALRDGDNGMTELSYATVGAESNVYVVVALGDSADLIRSILDEELNDV